MKLGIDAVRFDRVPLGWMCRIGFWYISYEGFLLYKYVEVTRFWWIAAFFAARWETKQVHGVKRWKSL